MTGYEKHLLGMAVEACGPNGLDVRQRGRSDAPKPWRAARWVDEHSTNQFSHVGWGATLTEALTALLADLGVEYPKRPSAERVAEAKMARPYVRGGEFSQAEDLGHLERVISLTRLRALYAREPLTVLALLEGKP